MIFTYTYGISEHNFYVVGTNLVLLGRGSRQIMWGFKIGCSNPGGQKTLDPGGEAAALEFLHDAVIWPVYYQLHPFSHMTEVLEELVSQAFWMQIHLNISCSYAMDLL